MIHLSNVSFGYSNGTGELFRDVSLDISAGEEVCLMGANGSGKSTLARLMAGLLKPEKGEIRFEPPDSTKLLEAGFLFQNPDNQMVAMTVDKELAFALENRAVPGSVMERQVSNMLDQMGIASLLKRMTNELSGGEKQRVALASSMIYHPPVLILDEPDSFLDLAGRKALDRILIELRDDHPELIVVRVTQYPEVALRHRRLIVLHNGSVIADGPPETVLGQSDVCREAGLIADTGSPTSTDSLLVAGLGSESEGTPTEVILKNVAFSYDPSRPIFASVDMKLKRGETVGLIGPTGSGKSTLGMILSGLVEPTSGSVTFLKGTRDIGVIQPGWVSGVFQMPERQFFLSSCSEEIGFGPRNLGRPLSSTQIGYLLELVGLDPMRFADRDPFSLSLGEKRRLAFAAVLSMSPAFVVFDEPTASLDPEGVGRFIQLSRKLRQLGMGQLIISHERQIIGGLSDRICCLPGDGSLLEIAMGESRNNRELLALLA